jgi:glycosyltransferase involved in cell wall biosynthesis
MLMARLMRKKPILIGTTSEPQMAKQIYRGSNLIIRKFIEVVNAILEGLSYRFCNRIIVESPSIVHQLNLEKYRRKLSTNGGFLFVDVNRFKPIKSLSERGNLVGYVGRLSEEKGIISLARAIPLILEQQNETHFLIVGDGHLFHEIEERLKDFKSNGKVTLWGWLSHDEVPAYLNELKLLVVPSYTEIGPMVFLEAMACATPVLGTSVGTMPDRISNGANGFILEDNSPECIARSVIMVLNHPNLEEVARNASDFIAREYTYEAAVERFRETLTSLGWGKQCLGSLSSG